MEDQDRLTRALADRYRIEREIGRGGMATVYLAEDLKHDRKVAVKVLKPELAAVMGTGRFLAEIRTTANLQHPHILPLFDSGEADGFLFYVMPYVEGESLREKLDRCAQLPVDEAVRIGCHLADALDYAHRHGVIHRDIKPGNILFQEDEPVVTDFGIALAVSAAGEGRLTETGLSLGTPYYMSPEQAAGDQIPTAPSDIYSLGCVLYEMLIGDPPHTGSSAPAILGKILLGEVTKPTKLRRTIPPHVEATVLRALEALPADRFESASALGSALEDRDFRHSTESSSGSAPGGFRCRKAMGVMALAALGPGLGLGWWIFGSREHVAPVSRYVVSLPGGLRSDAIGGPSITVSQDGSEIVYVGTVPGGQGRQLFLKSRDRLNSVPMAGSENALSPVLSPDGGKVAFVTPNPPTLLSLDLAGEVPMTLATGTLELRGLSWGSDGFLYAGGRNGILRVPEGGGSFALVTSVDTEASERRHIYPQVLPNGRGVLFANVYTPSEDISNHEVAVVDLVTGERKTLLSGLGGRYLSSGHIAYVTLDGTLMVVPFDLQTLTVVGPSIPVAEHVRVASFGVVDLVVTNSGDLLYQTGAAGGAENELVRVSRDGTPVAIDSGWKADFRSLSLSRDGTRLAVEVGGEPSTDIWMTVLEEGTRTRFTLEGSWNARPAWTPDGRDLTFVSRRGGNADVWTKPASGGGPPQLLLDRDRGVFEAFHSPDGDWLVFRTVSNNPGGGDILARRSGQDTVPVPLVATEQQEWSPVLSPNGRWLAFISDETGQFEVYVVPFPDTDSGRWQISTAGGSEPVWAHDGRELFYRNGADEMVSVRVETDPSFSHARQEALFSATNYRSLRGHQGYAVSPDDEWFFMIRTAGFDRVAELMVVENWFEELRGIVWE